MYKVRLRKTKHSELSLSSQIITSTSFVTQPQLLLLVLVSIPHRTQAKMLNFDIGKLKTVHKPACKRKKRSCLQPTFWKTTDGTFFSVLSCLSTSTAS